MNKRITYTTILITICLVIISYGNNVIAQESDTTYVSEIFELSFEELMNLEVITPSKLNESVDIAPATVYVITEQEIIENGYYSLTDLLKNIPGVVPIDIGFFTFGGQRGFLSNFSHTLILIDGREVQNLIASETFISHQFATHNIKQIEIIQGPGSALYGSNAYTGVINIITKIKDKEYDGIEYHLELGSQNTKAHNIIIGKNVGDFRISGSIRTFESDMWDFTDFVNDTVNFKEGYPNAVNVKNLKYHNNSTATPLSLRIDYKDFYIGTESYSLHTKKGLENVALNYTDQYDTRNFNLNYIGWDYDYNNKLNFNLEFQYYNEKFYGRNYSFNQEVYDTLVANGRDPDIPFTQDEVYDNFLDAYSQETSSGSKQYNVSLQTNYLTDKISIIGGYVYEYNHTLGIALSNNTLTPEINETVSDTNRMRLPFFKYNKNSLFLQVQKPIFKNKLYITLGGRFDYHEYHKEIYTVRSGLVYNPFKKTYLKFLFGQAFRGPNIFEQGAHTQIINPGINPSRINTYEFSVNHTFTKNIKVNVATYRNYATNTIIPIGTTKFINSDTARIVYGLESTLIFRIKKFKGDLGYSYVYSDEEKYAGVKTPSLGIYNHTLNTGLTYRLTRNIFINARANYYDKIKAKHGNPNIEEVITIPASTKFDANISIHEIQISDIKITAMISVKNIFDKDIYMPNVRIGGPKQFLQPGRQFIGQIAFKF